MLRAILLLLVSLGYCSQGNRLVYTQVTFLYDIKRGSLGSQYSRSYQYYLGFFDQLMTTSSNLIIFGNNDLKERVWRTRKQHNTVFVERELDWFKGQWYSPHIREIVKKNKEKKFYWDVNKALPQFGITQYNFLMMSKLYLMHQALLYDKFNSDVFIWTDGGFMHHFKTNLVYPYNGIENSFRIMNRPWLFFSYYDQQMFRNYQFKQFRYVKQPILPGEVVIANMFGGRIEAVKDMKNTFENLLRMTLEYGDLNSDQSIFTIMLQRYPYLTSVLAGLELTQRVRFYTPNIMKDTFMRHVFAEWDDAKTRLLIHQKDMNFSIIASFQVPTQANCLEIMRPINYEQETRSLLLRESIKQKETILLKSIFLLIFFLSIYILTRIVLNLLRQLYKGYRKIDLIA